MFVLGCHRSGTSLLAGIISDSLQLSEQNDLLTAQVDNPGGFFESKNLVDMNEHLLQTIGIDWQHPPLHPINWTINDLLPSFHQSRNKFQRQALSFNWVDKDPRLCLTYSAFNHILLKRIPIAGIIRHPYEVANSLYKRDMIPYAKGLIIWFLYNQHLSRHISEEDSLFCYEQLISSSDNPSELLCDFLISCNPNGQFNKEKITVNIQTKAIKGWQRSNKYLDSSIHPQIEWEKIGKNCLSLYNEILQSKSSISIFKKVFSFTPDHILCSCSVLGWQSLNTCINPINEKLKKVESELSQIKNSTSWKITSPLRFAANQLKK